MSGQPEERPLPRYVDEVFEVYLKCGRLEHGFLRVRCDSCHAEKPVTCGRAAKGTEREKLEHLARCIARPPIATERLALTDGGQIRYSRLVWRDHHGARPRP